MPPPLKLNRLAARRFVLRALGLGQPFAELGTALDHLGYVQIDPLNICGRMHDLILRNRVRDYREGELMRHIHGAAGAESTEGRTSQENDTAATPAPSRPANIPAAAAAHAGPLAAAERVAFEHHHPETHILVAFPLDAWPHLLGAMRARSRSTGAWSGRLTPTERKLAPQLLDEIRRRGPLSSDDFDDDRRARRIVWGASSLVKSTLQKLFFHGELLIAERANHRRRYDLPERVLPARILALPEAAAPETSRWLALLKLRQRRLATLKRTELATVADAVREVSVEGCPSLYCLNEDVPILQAYAGDPDSPFPSLVDPPGRVLLLAPLDPLIYDRRLTAALWDFDYTWEAYTPAAKRVRGHYALPVLAGTELVGHVEPKADRVHRKLVVASRSIRRGYKVGDALDELAAWLGVRR